MAPTPSGTMLSDKAQCSPDGSSANAKFQGAYGHIGIEFLTNNDAVCVAISMLTLNKLGNPSVTNHALPKPW
jgi:hypothetical protein